MALTEKLSAIGNAIRGQTGGTELLTLDQMATEIESISSGGNVNSYSGSIVFDNDTGIVSAGLTLDLGLPSRAKYFFLWMDKESFNSLETVSNNHYVFVLMLPVTLSEITPIRKNASEVIPDTADRFFLVGSYFNSTTAAENGYACTGLGNFIVSNTDIWAANEDGTITISRFSSAGAFFYAGKYNWIAVA